ncbi:glycosyltransferase family 20-domain-containing protein [Rhodocollybia butyracea]|uniref:Glycosyltransferase family 20-domain-containing protein n=1 Tax=Rhodocollybia butyracea TaxID=206335 RepID=A0A9P5U5K3_9AGAR|nr:glycosyltransferase family 20-domain-containing protein [Rhodocollybia butyracea]
MVSSLPILPTLPDIRASIAALEDRHRRNGVALSGRILHVCHSLPVKCTLHGKESAEPSRSKRWTLGPRYGHAAMISGIRSLSVTHDQVIIGWTGDIEGSDEAEVKVSDVSEEDKAKLDELLAKGGDDDDPTDGKDNIHKTGYAAVWMPSLIAHGYYDGYCKQILWPLFHYLLWQDVATEYASADSHYPHYEAANAAFARRIADIYQPGDLIWVHDYHLLLLPSLLRELLPDAVVGLFVHTPFPSSEVFRCLPRRKEILDGMLGANLVCFQNYSYSRHFVSTCIRVCGYESHLNGHGIENPSSSHLTAVSYCPVGIDAERVARDVLRPGIKPKFDALRTLYQGKKIIVGRDKLDVVKGVLQKLRAFEKMLGMFPEWVGRVVMIQVTSPSLSDSPKLERQVSEMVAHINGTYGSLDFIPCHHYHQTLKKDEFYALLSVADLAVITPLRDGMNTTSMEFVIAQERTKRSPSVLSELMGVMGILGPKGPGDTDEGGEEEPTSPGGLNGSSGLNNKFGNGYTNVDTPKRKLGWDSTSSSAIPTPNLVARGDPIAFVSASTVNGTNDSYISNENEETSPGSQGALWVNPWDLHTVASAMHRALLMPEQEKIVRHKYLYDVVTTRTSHMWASVLVKMLLQQMTASAHGAAGLNGINGSGSRKGTPYLDFNRMRKWYEAASTSIHKQPSAPRIKPTRLFFFDYDGTLAPIVKVPSAAVPSEQTLKALDKLCKDERNLVYIISGRDADFLDEYLGSVGTADGAPGLGFSAEHGGFVKEPRKLGGEPSPWRNFTAKLDMSWMSEVYEVFRYYTERTTGSHIEVKKSSITWHYRSADPEWGQFQCRQCQDLLENNLAHKRPIEVLVGKKNLEVRPIAVNKGEIVKRLVYKNPQVEFIFCVGDDKTDEDMFRALRQFTEHPSPTLNGDSSPDLSADGVSRASLNGESEGKAEFVMEAPLSVTLVDEDDDEGSDDNFSKFPPVSIHLSPDAVYSVAVGHSSKRTLASWHVTSPAEVIGAIEGILGMVDTVPHSAQPHDEDGDE